MVSKAKKDETARLKARDKDQARKLQLEAEARELAEAERSRREALGPQGIKEEARRKLASAAKG